MILVIGNTPQKVELRDLSDCVYYKQQKIFSDAQAERSRDLKKALKAGSLTILKKIDEKNGSFDIPAAGLSSRVEVTSDHSSDKIDALLDKIKSLEEAVTKNAQLPQGTVSSDISHRIEKLEKDMNSGGGDSKAIEALCGAVERLEKRLDKSSDSEHLLKKLETLIKRESVRSTAEQEAAYADDTYVPSVTVEDAKSHVKLDVRKIEKSDGITESLKKLKELKSKSK